MVKIRLKRIGKKHQPLYRIVAAFSESPRKGKYIEKIGSYDPSTKPPKISYDKAILEKWMKNGAQMTDTLYDAFVREGVIKQSKLRKTRISLTVAKHKKEKADAEKAAQPAAPAAPEAAPAPAEAPKAEEPKAEPKKEEKASEAPKEDKKEAKEPAKEEAKAPKKDAEAPKKDNATNK